MTDEARRKKTDLVLSNGEYAFTQDTTTGSVKVLTGPTVVNVTGQEYPVVYECDEHRFVAVDLEDAGQRSPMAAQGFYIELWNPPATESHAQPSEGSKESSPQLSMGQRVNIPGPTTFALWPRQIAKVIEGHHLRSNQYLLGRVYDEEAAKTNWKKAVLKTRAEGEDTIATLSEAELSVGKLFVIKGTEVSFYIPPTGVEVVLDEEGRFVRDALTLERLQYCILVDETGDKDYQRGPRVVFPKPTQRFFRDARTDSCVFRPTELNPIQGIHVKVIAPYREGERAYSEGEELFITGADTSIYFPRPEHALVRYDGSAKHFAIAVPDGEGRYVMDRNSGEIRLERGPTMLLPDPRQQVAVRRVLSETDCSLWYPGNSAAQVYNASLRALIERTPSTRAAVSEGEARRKPRDGGKSKRGGRGADTSSVHSNAAGAVADEWQRAATYAEPRTLTLGGKFAGVPMITPWTGYAVMVVNKRGERRVEIGPSTVLLEYDETLEVLELSTGLPKSSSETQRVVYLKIRNEHVRDLIVLETADHVPVAVRLTMRIDFAGDEPARWFAVPNFVKLLTDRVRRLAKNRVRHATINELWLDPEAMIREAVLGDGDLVFEANGMVLRDVEVTSTKITETKIAKLFDEAQAHAVASGIELDRSRQQLEIDRSVEAIARSRAEASAETERFRAQLDAEQIQRELELATARAEAAASELAHKKGEQAAADALANETAEQARLRDRLDAEQATELDRAKQAVRMAELEAETSATVARFKAAEGPVAEAIQQLGNQHVLEKVAEAISAQRLLGGQDLSEVIGNLFQGTHLAGVFERIQRGAAPADDRESE